MTDRPGFTAFLDEVERRLGRSTSSSTTPGSCRSRRSSEETDDSVTRQLELNLHAVIHGTKEAMRRMRPRGTGHIVNIASVAGKGGFPRVATYCATKHGVVGFSEAVRFELRGTGVEVSCVMPGIVNTELAAGLKDARVVKKITPEDVADAIVAALKLPRFDVFVPRSTGPLFMLAAAMPRRAREAFGRALKADQVVDRAPTPPSARPTRRAPRQRAGRRQGRRGAGTAGRGAGRGARA